MYRSRKILQRSIRLLWIKVDLCTKIIIFGRQSVKLWGLTLILELSNLVQLFSYLKLMIILGVWFLIMYKKTREKHLVLLFQTVYQAESKVLPMQTIGKC